VHPTQISTWKKQILLGLESLFANDKGNPHEQVIADLKQQNEQLYQLIGQLSYELDWMKKKST
jgi:hypothetical protein